MPHENIHNEENLGKVYDWKLMKKVLRYILPYKKLFVLATVFLLLSSALQLLVPYFFKLGIDKYIDDKTIPDDSRISGVMYLAIIIVAVLFIKTICEYGHVIVTQIMGQRAMLILRTQTFEHLNKLSLSYFDKNPVGRLVTRVTNDVEAINEMFSTILVASLKDILMFFGSIVVLLMLDWRLALISFSLLPVFLIVAMIFKKKVRRVFRDIRKYLARLNAMLTEDISGVKIIQAFRQEKRRREDYYKTNLNYYNAGIKQLVVFGIFRPLIDVITSVSTALVIVFAGISIMHSTMSIGTLVAFLLYIGYMFGPVVNMTQRFNIIQSSMAAAERIFNLLNEKPEIQENISTAGSHSESKGLVEFENVTFGYTEETDVLKNVSFKIEPGKSVAIVGPTGAGKTSIINLICRFYDTNSGIVKLDNSDVKNWKFEDLRKHVAIVLQDAFVFSRNVADNITLGDENISNEKLMHAAKMVQADSFINKLNDGFDEIMAERGATLSAGQRQLICFARALAHDPKVLILDEATSNVDPATESLIQNAIETLMKGRTSIIIAHRLNTIKKVDEIIVLDNGQILERGSHEKLFAQKGIYYNLCLMQYGKEIESETVTT
ncbi:MAG: ABC transporter ATP-binding protein [Chlamydiae bacterium]|nr:MAG: ABC transporter ATP-binding protein [Chlamydiota bacterium]